MAVINRTHRDLLASPRLRVAAGVVRQPGRFTSDAVVRWSQTRRSAAAEIDAAYAEARQILDADRRLAAERAAIVEEFVKARGHWRSEMYVLAKARRFDDAHGDSVYDELHAEQLYGAQYSEVA